MEPAEELYTVEKILDKVTTADGHKYYRIKWKGYPASQATWEPVENLSSFTDLLFDFEIRYDGKPKKKEKPEKRSTDKYLSDEEEGGPKKKIKVEKPLKESQKEKNKSQKKPANQETKEEGKFEKRDILPKRIVTKDTSRDVHIFSDDNEEEQGFNIVEIHEEELEPESTLGTISNVQDTKIFPARKGSLSSEDKPKMVLKAEVLSDDKCRFFVSWDLDSNEIQPEPSYVTNRQLKNCHPVFLCEYYEKLVFQNNLIKRS